MKQRILTLALLASMIIPCGLISMQARAAIEVLELDNQNISITVSGSVLHVSGADGLVLKIYNITGVQVASFKVEGYERHYNLNLSKGCYLVKVGKVVRKIYIK